MRMLSSRRCQRGYLLEVPVLFAVTLIVLVLVLPSLSPPGQKVAVAIAAALSVFFLYYMIVIPGWRPGGKGRLGRPWNWVAFLLVAGAIVTGAVAFLFA